MKKLLLWSLFICIFPSFCFAFCGDNRISFQGNQAPGDDEFVYALTSDYEDAILKEKNKNYSFKLEGPMWECDNEQGCKYYTAILAPSGHAWDKNKNRGETLYWCTSSWGDKWQEYELVACTDNFYESLKKNPSLGNFNINMNGTTDKVVYKIESNGGKTTTFCYTEPERVTCIKETGTIWADNKCQCLELNGKKRSWNGRICVETTKTSTPDDETTPLNNDGDKRPSCRDSRSTLNGKACCDTGSLGKYNSATDTCTCSADLDFVIENGTGYCRAKQGSPGYTCPAAQLNWIANLKISCGNNTEIQSQIQMIENYCKGQGVSETAFNEYVSQLMTLSAQLCGTNTQSDEEKLCEQILDAHMVGDVCKCDDENKEVNRSQRRCVESAAFNTAIAISTRRIDEAKDKLDNLANGFKTTVWKTAEGKFNTSRLASDSIAGVVLGTAGGLITSNVMKKNQVENGFEDIQCTVGGQVVAGWGDEFRVGIQ